MAWTFRLRAAPSLKIDETSHRAVDGNPRSNRRGRPARPSSAAARHVATAPQRLRLLQGPDHGFPSVARWQLLGVNDSDTGYVVPENALGSCAARRVRTLRAWPADLSTDKPRTSDLLAPTRSVFAFLGMGRSCFGTVRPFQTRSNTVTAGRSSSPGLPLVNLTMPS